MPGDSSIAVLGAGSWGTALACLTARSGKNVFLWSADPSHAAAMTRDRVNEKYLPGIPLETKITPTDNLHDFEGVNSFILAVPSHAFREVLQKMSPLLKNACVTQNICWGTKGFEPKTSLLLSDVVIEELGNQITPAVVSGPSFAGEVGLGLPTALTVAARNIEAANEIATWFRDSKTRVYASSDIQGVQLGGALKNVIAIAAGISDGLGFGANARAALITRGLAELARFGQALGGQAETFSGLTGLGDLILTCTDDQSRNRRVGLAIGHGETMAQAIKKVGQEAEGINSARELYRKSQTLKVEMPISEQVYRVLFEGHDPSAAVTTLLEREPKTERP